MAEVATPASIAPVVASAKSRSSSPAVARASFARNPSAAALGSEKTDAKATQEVPANHSILSGSRPVDPADRSWRQIAGPPLIPSQFRCATLGCNALDEVKRLEARNRTALKAAEQVEVEANGDFSEPDWQEAVSPDEVRCSVTRSRPVATKAQIAAAPAVPDDLSIPAFLDRRKAEAEPKLRMAA